MEIGSAVIGPEGGHEAGRRLLAGMYKARFGREMPEISVTERGKPYFRDNSVYFSISHTPRYVFCALSDCPVGMDAEQTDRTLRLELADKILSPREKERFARKDDKRQALLRFWVLKEAAAKCSGMGLTGYPNDTDFSPDDSRIQIINDCFVAVIKENP